MHSMCKRSLEKLVEKLVYSLAMSGPKVVVAPVSLMETPWPTSYWKRIVLDGLLCLV